MAKLLIYRINTNSNKSTPVDFYVEFSTLIQKYWIAEHRIIVRINLKTNLKIKQKYLEVSFSDFSNLSHRNQDFIDQQYNGIKLYSVCIHAAAAAKSVQSCPTLCDPIDGSPPGSPIPGILQARTLEWVAISFSNAWKWKVKVKSLSRVRLFATPWTVAYQPPPSMEFSRQKYWSGLPLPSPIKYIEITN